MFSSDNSKWAAVQARDPAADGAYVYCVRTTKIYCRPTCKARLARRSNVVFHLSPVEAATAGYRACKRCKPQADSPMPEEDAVRKVRGFLAKPPGSMRPSTLDDMAKQSSLSKWHFHRVFKKVAGMTPNEYVKLLRKADSEDLETLSQPPCQLPTPSSDGQNLAYLDSLDPIPLAPEDPEDYSFDGYENMLDPMSSFELATFDPLASANLEISGYQDSESAQSPPFDWPIIRFSIRKTSFGLILIAFDDVQLCMITQADEESQLLAMLNQRFPALLYRHIPISET